MTGGCWVERSPTPTERHRSMESVKHYITDVDGVLVTGTQLLTYGRGHRLFRYRPTWLLG